MRFEHEGGAIFKNAKGFSVSMLQSWAAGFFFDWPDGSRQRAEDRFSSISFFFLLVNEKPKTMESGDTAWWCRAKQPPLPTPTLASSILQTQQSTVYEGICGQGQTVMHCTNGRFGLIMTHHHVDRTLESKVVTPNSTWWWKMFREQICHKTPTVVTLKIPLCYIWSYTW